MTETRTIHSFWSGRLFHFRLLFVFFWTILMSPALRAETITIDSDRQFQFAEDCFKSGKYGDAVREYERFIYFFPNDERISSALFKVAESYFNANRFEPAIPAFRAVIEKFPGSDLAVASYFKISTSFARLRKYENALGVLDELSWNDPDPNVKDEIYYRKGWVLLESDRWDDARQSFAKIQPQSTDRYGLQGLLEDMNKPLPPMKNPRVAGALALLPGAGHLYCERYRDAFISFVINGAMILAAWEAFDNDNEALGGLLTVFEIGFYSANIYSAANSAHKYNRKQKQDLLENLKKHATLEVSAVRSGDSPGLALTCSIRF